MKYLLYTISLTLLLYSCVSSVRLTVKNDKLLGILPLENGMVVYREKVSSPNIPKAEVFKRARRWWVDRYRSTKDVIQIADKQTGEIVGKGYNNIFRKPGGFAPLDLDYFESISIDIADDYYIVTVKGFKLPLYYVKRTVPGPYYEIPVERYNQGSLNMIRTIFEELDNNTKLTISSLKDAINRPIN